MTGTVVLLLGGRTIKVSKGQAAEFSTMVPHAFGAHGGPAEIIAILDPDGDVPTYDAEAGLTRR